MMSSSPGASCAGLSRMASGTPTLPTSCSGAARSIIAASPSARPSVRASSPDEPADAARVLAGVVVAILGGARQAVDDLDVRAGEGARPLLDRLLEPLLLALELGVELARDQQVADAQQRLDAVERLGQEVARAHRQRPLLDRRRVVGRDDQHRQVALDGEQRPQRLHHLEAVEVRHVQVEDDQVGPRDRHLADHLARVGQRGDVAAARGRQQPVEHPHVGRLVVDDEDPRRAQHVADGDHLAGFSCGP